MTAPTRITPQPTVNTARKLLFFSDAPYEGGAERYIEYLVGSLSDEWRVSIVTRERGALDAWVARLEEDGVHVIRAADTTTGLLSALWREVRRGKPDVVHVNLPNSYSAFYTVVAPLARLAGARSIVTTEHLTMITPMRLRGLLRRAMTAFVDRVITISESNRSDLTESHRLPASRVRVVFNGVPKPPEPSEDDVRDVREALGVSEGEALIVHLGALTERKGHRFLLRAAATLLDLSWHMAFVGDGEDADALTGLARELGMADRLTLTGHRDDVGAILGAADVLVLPSRLEGMPLVLLEALALGTPAITTTVYGVPEIYAGGDAAVLVPYGDERALASALDQLVSDPERRSAMGAAARDLYTARYTAERMTRETVVVYEEALA